MRAGVVSGVARVEDVKLGGWRTESVVRESGGAAEAHAEHPGHAARLSGQGRGRSKKCREHAFGWADSAIAPWE